MSNTLTHPRRCAWPSAVPLPQGQSYMSDTDWIAFIEEHLADIEQTDGVDRARLEDTRRSLLILRRYHYASAGRPSARWTSRGGRS